MLRIALLLPDPDADALPAPLRSALNGARLGLDEAAHTYELLGRDIGMVELPAADRAALHDFDATVSVAELAQLQPPVCSGFPPVFIDARARPGVLPDCGPADADAPLAIGVDAVDRLRVLDAAIDDAREVGSAAASREAAPDVLLWHPALHRYGARQLNDRFEARFRQPMDEHAWAGWLAVKMIAEASLRARTRDAAAIRARLTDRAARFDGHKGQPLRFAPDGRLVQPIYLLRHGRIFQVPGATEPLDDR